MKPRILFAGLFHETHTFVAERTRWEDFDVVRGEAVFGKRGDASPTDGFLEEAERQGFEVLPTLDLRATPSGTVEDRVFERFWTEFSSAAQPHLTQGVDGIFLVLHGAMATETIDDAEGVLLERLRSLPGAANVPIFGVLDLHGNISEKMCRHANGLVMYRENPHTDAKQAAVRGTKLLGRCLREGKVPKMNWCRIPLMWAPPGTGTAASPLRALKEFALVTESTDPEIWAINYAAGFSFADTPETGLTLSVVSTASVEQAHTTLRRGAELGWSLRKDGDIRYDSAHAVVARCLVSPRPAGPTLLVEPSDNIGAGAPGDGTGVLRALLDHNVENALVVINDPVAVTALADVRVGEKKSIAVGGRSWVGDEGPVKLDVTLLSRSDGKFTLEDANSHLASMSGLHFEMGSCAVVRSAGVTLLLTSRKTPPFDLAQLRSQGLEPTKFAFIGVKAAVAHKRAYDPITGASFYVETPGPCSSRPESFQWKRVRRPVWPLDPIDHPTFLFS